jgi:uncharacterized protein
VLEELEESGFIESRIPFGKKANDSLYRISDEFTLFYFSWIKNLGKKTPGYGYWMSRQSDPKRFAWAGYAFESICLKHVKQMKVALGITMVETSDAPWRYQANAKSSFPGTQIDLLIDRRDATINICEMKFSQSEFTIDSAYAKELRQKKEVFRQATGTKKNIFITMLTTYGVNNNPYYKELVANSLTMNDLF